MNILECQQKAIQIQLLYGNKKKIIFDVKVPGGWMAVRWLDAEKGFLSEPEPTGYMTVKDFNAGLPNALCNDLRTRD